MITVRQIDLKNSEYEDEIIDLLSIVFQEDKLPQGFLFLNITSPDAGLPSLFLAAFEGGKIIGCNAFIANDFEINQRSLTCFQSCWSATHPEHQGKGVFLLIQENAKQILKKQGAALIYGLPNDVSHPIFTSKLDFFSIQCMLARIPNIPLIRNLWFKNLVSLPPSSSKVLKPNECQVSALKKNLNSEIIEIAHNESYLWGKMESRNKFGIRLKIFSIGGMQIKSKQDLYAMLRKIYSFRCHFIEIYSCKSNLHNNFFRFWQVSSTHRFIFFYLNLPEDAIINFNLMRGVSDTF
jgi:GNAT superfamily N-acetyltransferase